MSSPDMLSTAGCSARSFQTEYGTADRGETSSGSAPVVIEEAPVPTILHAPVQIESTRLDSTPQFQPAGIKAPSVCARRRRKISGSRLKGFAVHDMLRRGIHDLSKRASHAPASSVCGIKPPDF